MIDQSGEGIRKWREFRRAAAESDTVGNSDISNNPPSADAVNAFLRFVASLSSEADNRTHNSILLVTFAPVLFQTTGYS